MEGPCTIDASWDGAAEAPTAALEIGGCTLPDWNAPGGTVWRPCRYAFGMLHIRPDNNLGFDASLEIGVEAYILGISESPYAWGNMGAQAALEAQAVAARSYALHRALDRGDPASRPWCWCHVYDTAVDQYYAGWGHATQPWLDAVSATAGQVMTHPSETRNGALIPIETFYSSSTFGWTEDSENGFTAYVPYLRAVDDHWSRLASTGNPNARWTRTFTAGDLASRLPGMSTVTGATVTRCSATGAALEITFSGQGGPRTFTTRDLRGRLGLRSMQVYNVGAPPPDTLPCSGPATAPIDPGGPVVLAAFTLDDDALGDSRGDADGVAECGEAVEAFTTLTNQGLALAGVSATLTSADPYVTVLWNTASGYPDLAAGATADNTADWDLGLAADTPNGHTALLDLHVTAGNGGPWDLQVALPIACATPARGRARRPRRRGRRRHRRGRRGLHPGRLGPATQGLLGRHRAGAGLGHAGAGGLHPHRRGGRAPPRPLRGERGGRAAHRPRPPGPRRGGRRRQRAPPHLLRAQPDADLPADHPVARSRRRLAHPGHPGPGPRRGRPGHQARRRHRGAPGTDVLRRAASPR